MAGKPVNVTIGTTLAASVGATSYGQPNSHQLHLYDRRIPDGHRRRRPHTSLLGILVDGKPGVAKY